MGKVLVVDDEPMIVEIVCAALEDAAFETTPAFSFRNAQTVLSSAHSTFDCIVVDKNLGADGSGWDLARIARGRSPNVGVVYISGADARHWASEGVPGSVMVQKPFLGDQIVTAVSRLVATPPTVARPVGRRSSAGSYVDVLEAMFEDAPGFMALGEGKEPRFTFANKAYRQLVGNRPLIGRTVYEALPELCSQGILEILDRVHQTGEPFVAYGMPISLETAPGRLEQKFIDVIYHAVTDETGSRVGLSAQGHDVTQQRLAQQRLEALRGTIVENARIKTMDAMASAIAHELNQPLTTISNDMWTAQQLLKDDRSGTGITDCLVRAGQSAVRAADIIRKLRKMASKGQPETERFDLQKVAQDAIDLAITGVCHAKVTYAAHPPIDVMGDPVQLQQVLINLVKNACDAMGAREGSIEVLAAAKDHFVEISVNDSGPGIPSHMLTSMFDAFTTSKPDGMGIGLRICREIVETHGGRITAQNLAHGGASICFTMPLAHD